MLTDLTAVVLGRTPHISGCSILHETVPCGPLSPHLALRTWLQISLSNHLLDDSSSAGGDSFGLHLLNYLRLPSHSQFLEVCGRGHGNMHPQSGCWNCLWCIERHIRLHRHCSSHSETTSTQCLCEAEDWVSQSPSVQGWPIADNSQNLLLLPCWPDCHSM